MKQLERRKQQKHVELKTDKWKWFIYEEIFDVLGGFYNLKPDSAENGEIPFIGGTEFNNGVTSSHDIETLELSTKDGKSRNHDISKKIFKGGEYITISNNGSVGYAFYQPLDFTCSHDVCPVTLKNFKMNKYIAMFLCGIIGLERYRWNYGRKWRPTRMKKSEIKLPADKSGNPDWQFMEDYIKSLPHLRAPSKMPADFQRVKMSSHPSEKPKQKKHVELKTDNWKPFLYGDVFKIKRGKRLTEADRIKGNMPYFSASQFNNGCTDSIDNPLFAEKDAIIYTTFGDAFYVEGEFTASDEISIFKNDRLNVYNGHFIATIILQNKYKYSFGRKAFRKQYKNDTFFLPADKSGNPDWQFMEDYIKSLPYSSSL